MLTVMSVVLVANFWPCQQDFYYPSHRGYDHYMVPATKPLSRQVKPAKKAVLIDKMVNLTWLDLTWLVLSWLGLSC
ncbi:hypothetical protein IWW34DRAFT_772211 [Fusarium oxysporum f. sp. albedinis]|nr:hypothetical protein IWW34DRAFT_772211 [Fusarium oxysporum f. sp. albedinis]